MKIQYAWPHRRGRTIARGGRGDQSVEGAEVEDVACADGVEAAVEDVARLTAPSPAGAGSALAGESSANPSTGRLQVSCASCWLYRDLQQNY